MSHEPTYHHEHHRTSSNVSSEDELHYLDSVSQHSDWDADEHEAHRHHEPSGARALRTHAHFPPPATVTESPPPTPRLGPDGQVAGQTAEYIGAL